MGKRHWPPCVWRTVRSCGGTAAPCRWSMLRRPSGSKRRRSLPTLSARGPKPWRRCVRAKRSTSTNSILRERAVAPRLGRTCSRTCWACSPRRSRKCSQPSWPHSTSVNTRLGSISTVPGVDGATRPPWPIMEFPYTCGVERHEAAQAPARVLAHWSNFDTHTLILESCGGSLSLCVNNARTVSPLCNASESRECWG